MKSNPFDEQFDKNTAFVEKNEHTLNLFSHQTDFNLPKAKTQEKTLKEKSLFLLDLLIKNIKNLFYGAFKKILYPVFSKSQKASTLIKAQATSIKGSRDSEVYQLLNMLSNKKHYIAIKASVRLETIISDKENSKIVSNYFKLNPEARDKYNRLYNLVSQTEANKL